MSVMTAEPAPVVRARGYCNTHPDAPLVPMKRFERYRNRLTLIVEVSVCEECKNHIERTVSDGKFKFRVKILKDNEEPALADFHQGFYTPFEGRKWLGLLERTLSVFLFSLRAHYFANDRTFNKLINEAFDELKEFSDKYPERALDEFDE